MGGFSIVPHTNQRVNTVDVVDGLQKIKNRAAHAVEDAWFGDPQEIDGYTIGKTDLQQMSIAGPNNFSFVGSREQAEAKLTDLLSD